MKQTTFHVGVEKNEIFSTDFIYEPLSFVKGVVTISHQKHGEFYINQIIDEFTDNKLVQIRRIILSPVDTQKNIIL